MALVKFLTTLLTLFGKKKKCEKSEEKKSLEEMKLEEEIRKEKRGRERTSEKRENWHQTSQVKPVHLPNGEKIIKLIRTEEDERRSEKMGNVYEKSIRMLKNERRRQKVMERKRELEEIQERVRYVARSRRYVEERGVKRFRLPISDGNEKQKIYGRDGEITEKRRLPRRLVCEVVCEGPTKTCLTHRLQITNC